MKTWQKILAGIFTVLGVGVGSFVLGSYQPPQGSTGSVQFKIASGELQGTSTLIWDNTNGRLGIGTSTPSHTFVVSGDTQLTGGLYDRTNATGTSGQILQSTGTGVTWVNTSSLAISGSVSGGTANFLPYWTGASTLATASSTNGFLYWDNTNGRLGIGTTTPLYDLYIEKSVDGGMSNVISNTSAGTGAQAVVGAKVGNAFGGIYSSGANYTTTTFFSPNGVALYSSSGATGGLTLGVGNNSANIRFMTNQSTRMTILSSGEVGIGTTTPATALSVNGTITQSAVKSCSLGLTTDANGSITGCVSSDANLKQNVKSDNSSIDGIMSLETKDYQFKDRPEQNRIGLVAQDVEKVFPDLVIPFYVNGEEMKSVDYNGVTALLVKAVQSQQKQINSLSGQPLGAMPTKKSATDYNDIAQWIAIVLLAVGLVYSIKRK